MGNYLIANEDETLSCKDKIQKKKLCKIFTTWSQGKWSLEVEVKGTGNRWNHVYIQGNTLIGLTTLPFTFINKKKERNNLFKISHDVRKKEDKTLKYFQSCFWELYSENTDCNVQRLSHQSKKDFCISVHDAPPDDKGIKR